MESPLGDSKSEVRRVSFDEVPTPALIEELFWHVARIFRAQRRKVREQLKEGAKLAFAGGLLTAMGAALTLIGGLILALDAVYLLAFVMPLWVSALIIGGGAATCGGLLAFGATSELRKAVKQATEAKEEIEEDAAWAQETFRQAKRSHADA